MFSVHREGAQALAAELWLPSKNDKLGRIWIGPHISNVIDIVLQPHKLRRWS